MVNLGQGVVVPVKFPFSDLTRTKWRPALVLAYAEKGDWVLCQITSKAYSDQSAVIIQQEDFIRGGLPLTSYARPGKLFTANETLLEPPVGQLAKEKHEEVIDGIIAILKQNI
ncbi:type II toxin-antitoxin system PemK/MazF family toxin [Endozoicomonas sp. Mp262]|uniref:type II toxin-antitoxin system PemK/MazF family toxin n=1 Tax=Endozoicomonas sp. Mp262 TaxID=2919499 RepID=UPI0021DB4D22